MAVTYQLEGGFASCGGELGLASLAASLARQLWWRAVAASLECAEVHYLKYFLGQLCNLDLSQPTLLNGATYR